MTSTARDPTTLADWIRHTDDVRPRDGIYIDGEFRPARSGSTFDCVNPATGTLLAAVASAQAGDVDDAVRSSRRAFESGEWSRSSVGHRREVLLRLAELINTHRIELALLDSLDMGKLVNEAFTVDVPSAAGLFTYYGEALTRSTARSRPPIRAASHWSPGNHSGSSAQ